MIGTITPLDRRARVADIVAAHPECARVLSEYRIDFCCKGGVPLEDACAQRGVDLAAVVAGLEAARRDGRGASKVDLRSLPTPALVAHIVGTHHAYLRGALPWVTSMAAKVDRVHGAHDPRLARVATVLRELATLLLRHLDEEETELFPALMARSTRPDALAAPLDAMRREHRAIGDALAELAALTERYAPPTWACTTYRTLLAELANLEEDTLRHVHLENHVLAERFNTQEETT